MTAAIRPADLPRFVPGELLSASDGLGWKGLSQRSYRYRALDVEVPPLDHFTLVLYRVGRTPMERRYEGRWSRATCAPGDVSLLTRGQASHWHWTEGIDVEHIYLSEALVSRVAQDMLGRSAAEVRLHDLLRTEDAVLASTAAALVDESRRHGVGGSLYAEALGTQLAVHLLRHHASVSAPPPRAASPLAPGALQRVADYVEAHLHRPLGLEDLAAEAGLGVWTFARRFRAAAGTTPHAFVLDRRIARARQLLAERELALKEVAAACGFADQAHMTRVFRERLGTTPARLRRTA